MISKSKLYLLIIGFLFTLVFYYKKIMKNFSDNGEESEEDTDNALAKALANITKDTTAPKLREIKKSLRNEVLRLVMFQ